MDCSLSLQLLAQFVHALRNMALPGHTRVISDLAVRRVQCHPSRLFGPTWERNPVIPNVWVFGPASLSYASHLCCRWSTIPEAGPFGSITRQHAIPQGFYTTWITTWVSFPACNYFSSVAHVVLLRCPWYWCSDWSQFFSSTPLGNIRETCNHAHSFVALYCCFVPHFDLHFL